MVGLPSPAHASQAAAGISAIAAWTLTAIVPSVSFIVHSEMLGPEHRSFHSLRPSRLHNVVILPSQDRRYAVAVQRVARPPHPLFISPHRAEDQLCAPSVSNRASTLHIVVNPCTGRDLRRRSGWLDRKADSYSRRAEICQPELADAGRATARTGFPGHDPIYICAPIARSGRLWCHSSISSSSLCSRKHSRS